MNTSRSNHKLIRLSHILSETTPSYGNRDSFRVRKASSISNGASANTSRWEFTNNHIGTHVDAPSHFDPQGLATSDIDTSNWFFNSVMLVDMPCSGARLINVDDLKNFDISSDVEMLLIRTSFENYRHQPRYHNDNPGLDAELAPYFRDNFPSLRCVGFDFISVTSWKYRTEGRVSHKAFLYAERDQHPIMPIEDMALNAIDGNIEWVVVAPLIVENGNGGPVTVFAKIEE
ncbi:MAG: cyclase family protein [Planctomycetes bacterium]|nr:cyclase family protein [Planctomycetota bacterium]